jgi:glycine/D-amino acid oxidase-like deaminating enzyme
MLLPMSYWSDRTSAHSRRSYPSLRKGQHTSDAVVIGGGLAGAAAAYALAHAGLQVMLVEQGRVAAGATAHGTGTIVPEPDTWFRWSAEMRGLRHPKAAWHETHRHAVEFATVLDKQRIHCDLELTSVLVNARTADALATIKKEHAARKAAGVATPWIGAPIAARELGTESEGAIRLHGAAVYDPVRAALGLIGAAEHHGAKVFERSRVMRTTFTRKYADVYLETGARVRTTLIFVATGEPSSLFGQLRRHVKRFDGYVVVTEPMSGPMRREVGPRKTLSLERNDSTRRVRWLAEDRVLFAGAEQKTVATTLRDKALRQRAAELMYELSVRYPIVSGIRAEWAWDVPVVTTLDGLPWIGLHRNYPFHFFSIAHGWHGDALAWFAAKAAVRHVKGEARKEDDACGFLRAL